jgi:hypothetical protein
MNPPYSEDTQYQLIGVETFKMLNSDEFKKDLIEKCYKSFIASDTDKYNKFTNTYYYILLMHLNIFINNDDENQNIEDFINYICIYLLLQAFFSNNKVLVGVEKSDIDIELYKNIIIMLNIACNNYENENNKNKMHMKKISEYLFELNKNNKIDNNSINALSYQININDIKLQKIKEIKVNSSPSSGGAAPAASGADPAAASDSGDGDASAAAAASDSGDGDASAAAAASDSGDGDASARADTGADTGAPAVVTNNPVDPGNSEDNEKNVILLNAFKIKMINEIMFFSEENLNIFKDEFKSFQKK